MASESFTAPNGTALESHTAGGNVWLGAGQPAAGGFIIGGVACADGVEAFSVSGRASNSSLAYSKVTFKAGAYPDGAKRVHVRATDTNPGYWISASVSGGNIVGFGLWQSDGAYLVGTTGMTPVSTSADQAVSLKATTVGGNVELRAWINTTPLTWLKTLKSNSTPGVVFTDISTNTPPPITSGGSPGFSADYFDGIGPANSGFEDWTDSEPDGVLQAQALGVASASAQLTAQIRAAAAAADVASASGSLFTAIRLAMAAVSNATASGLLSTQILPRANASALATATGSFASGAVLAASALDVVTSVAALTTSVRLGGVAVDTALATGVLTNWATVTLAGELYTGPGGVLDPNFWVDVAPTVGTTLYYEAEHIEITPNGEISSNTNNCAATVQFRSGSEWVLGVVVVTPLFAAVANDSASAAGQLSSAIRLAASASALATASAAFSTGAGLAATASDTTSASGAMTTRIPVSALAADVSSAVGALFAQIRLAATAAGRADAHADMNGIIAMSAAAVAVSSSTAPLATQIRAAADAFDAANGVASITTAIRASAAARDTVDAAANLATAIALGGAASDVVSASGDLLTMRLLVASAFDVATAIAVLSTGIELEAHDQAVSRASADLSASIRMLADASSTATATADLTDIIQSPPIGAYASDPRFYISKTRAEFPSWERRTPRFNAKEVGESAVLTFDLSAALDVDEHLQGPITLTISSVAGSDASPRTLFVGVPSYDMTRRKILQPVRGGIAGCYYYVRILVGTNRPYKALAMTGLLPVKPS